MTKKTLSIQNKKIFVSNWLGVPKKTCSCNVFVRSFLWNVIKRKEEFIYHILILNTTHHPSLLTPLSLLIFSWIPSSNISYDTCQMTQTHNSKLSVTKHLRTVTILVLDTKKIWKTDFYWHWNQPHKWTTYKEDLTMVNFRSTDSQSRWL
jgi:hypothetical protein